MKSIVPAAVAVALTLVAVPTASQAQALNPPPTPARPVTDVVHGMTLTDPYRWLEDNKNEEVVKWTRAQHDAALAWMDKNVPEVPGLKDELTRYTDRTITSPPSFYKGREFFTRKVKGDAQAKLYTRIDGKEVLLFDPMKIDPSGKSALSGRAYSRDASILAVGLQRAGDELPTQFFINSKTGEQVYAPLPQVWSVSWTKDNAVAYVQPRTQEQVSKQLPLYTQRMDLRKPILGQPVVHKFTDAKQWGGVADYEYSPYTVFSTGEGKRAVFDRKDRQQRNTAGDLRREGCQRVDRNDWRQHLRMDQRRCAERSPAQRQRGEARVQGLEADRRRAEGRGA